MDNEFYASLPDAVMNDKEKLFAHVTSKFGDSFAASDCETTDSESITARLFESHSADRVVVFRPRAREPVFGCIRVLPREEDTMINGKKVKKPPVWEKVRSTGAYMGLIPAGSEFEAMVIEVELITKR